MQRTDKIACAVIVGVLALSVLGATTYRSVQLARARHAMQEAGLKREAALAEHRAARADSERIDRGIKAYWSPKNRLAQLENDELRLKDDQLRHDIAALQGRTGNRLRIKKDMAVVQNDELALSLVNSNAAMALTPDQAEERIEEHNRKYPRDKLAGIADINKEMDRFHSQIEAIIDQSNEKLRAPSK